MLCHLPLPLFPPPLLQYQPGGFFEGFTGLAGLLSFFFLVLSSLVCFCLGDVHDFYGGGATTVGVSIASTDMFVASMTLDNLIPRSLSQHT